ncbi:MAG TPA: GNAT family N-acetyltransferase [Anaerolineales bacterium]|nr:GNAT family N-acetyltransferase [Anaerolineales bacterium]
MTLFDIRPAIATDIPHLAGLDHSCMSDYVWQLELRRDVSQITASFREVRLPRSIRVSYPRNPASLADDWKRRAAVIVALNENNPVGYVCVAENHSSRIGWVTDIVVAPDHRRKGAASALLTAAQAWGSERAVRRLVLEMQSKNEACIRLAQKFGYEFCGYNDQYYPTQDVALFFGRVLK